MRNFVSNLVMLLKAGQLTKHEVSYFDQNIPSRERSGQLYSVLKDNTGSAIAYVVRGCFIYRVSTLDMEENIELTWAETKAFKKACMSKVTEPLQLARMAERLLQDYQDKILKDGKQLTQR